MRLKKGMRVNTPYGPGTVVYWRNAPPTYTEPEAVSVRLDSKCAQPNYAGTIVQAKDCAEYKCACGKELGANGYCIDCDAMPSWGS